MLPIEGDRPTPLPTQMRRGGHYLFCSKRGPFPPYVSVSKGLGYDLHKDLGPQTVGQKSALKHAQERTMKEVNEGKQRLVARALRAATTFIKGSQ